MLKQIVVNAISDQIEYVITGEELITSKHEYITVDVIKIVFQRLI